MGVNGVQLFFRDTKNGAVEEQGENGADRKNDGEIHQLQTLRPTNGVLKAQGDGGRGERRASY